MGHGGDLVLVNPLVITQFDVICIDMSGSENERPAYHPFCMKHAWNPKSCVT